MPQETEIPTYCNCIDLRKSLLVKHKITEADHEFMVRLFFDDNFPDSKSFTAQEIIQGISGDCENAALKFEGDCDNAPAKDSNTDILIVSLPQKVTLGDYSFPFITAIFEKYHNNKPVAEQINRFELSKAISDHADYKGRTFVIRVVNNQNIPVYFADFSGLHP